MESGSRCSAIFGKESDISINIDTGEEYRYSRNIDIPPPRVLQVSGERYLSIFIDIGQISNSIRLSSRRGFLESWCERMGRGGVNP